MSYLESKYYADPHFILCVDEQENQDGEYLPVEIGYAYKVGRGKSLMINSQLNLDERKKQLLYEATAIDFWPYPGPDPSRAKMRRPNLLLDPHFLLTLPKVAEVGIDRRSHEIIRQTLAVEVGRAYKVGRGQSQMIKALLEPGDLERELLCSVDKIKLKPFVRVIPESLGVPEPVEAPTYRLAAALSR